MSQMGSSTAFRADLKLTLLHFAFGPTNRHSVGVFTGSEFYYTQLPAQSGARLSRRYFRLPRMLARPLGQNEDANNDESANDDGCDRPAQGQTAVTHRFVKEVAYRRAERARQDEGRPK